MLILADHADAVIGVDTHADTHTAAVASPLGAHLATFAVPADAAGYAELIRLAAAAAPGPRLAWAVEGCGSYGAGLAAALAAAGQLVTEAPRPRRAAAARTGKSDELDALRAARAALAGPAPALPRSGEAREALRILLAAREHDARARTAAVNTLKALLVTAPEDLRASFRGIITARQVRAAAALADPGPGAGPARRVMHAALRGLAAQVTDLDTRLAASRRELTALIAAWMPALLEQPGVGPVTAARLLVTWSHPGRVRSEAAFAALTGTAPLPAGSGRTSPLPAGSGRASGRHRLSRAGDRRANAALHVIATARLRTHPPTIAYAARRRAEGKTAPEIRRCIKRYLARSLYRLMQRDALDNT
jgi:transposase